MMGGMKPEGGPVQISSRFTMAIHVFCCIDVFGPTTKVTSELLASSIGTNPVVVRRLLGQLREAGLVTVARGSGGCRAARPLEEITLLDVYRAVEPVEAGELFRVHESPNPECPVGRNIEGLLEGRLDAAQQAMERVLASQTLADLHDDLAKALVREEGSRRRADD